MQETASLWDYVVDRSHRLGMHCNLSVVKVRWQGGMMSLAMNIMSKHLKTNQTLLV